MNTGAGHAHDSRFGPPSEPINVSEFLKTIEARQSIASDASDFRRAHWDVIAEAEREAIQAECSVATLQSSLNAVLDNPRLSGHLVRTHRSAVSAIHHTADLSAGKSKKGARSDRPFVPDPADEVPDVIRLRDELDAVKLKAWPLTVDAAFFMRLPKLSDRNALHEVKHMGESSTESCSTSRTILTFTIHTPLSWNRGLTQRTSQHAVLETQTLGDLYDVIPCPSNEMPAEKNSGDEYDVDQRMESGHVIVLDGVAYGDGASDPDYADMLLAHLQGKPDAKKQLQLRKAETSMHDTPFSALTLRLHEPYWLLHQGSCEHFVVLDEIRMLHPSDPPPHSGYPLTLQVTPPLLDMCRACARVPAAVAVSGDLRLGESPCLLCEGCWDHIGMPKDEEDGDRVVVVPLVKHQHGW